MTNSKKYNEIMKEIKNISSSLSQEKTDSEDLAHKRVKIYKNYLDYFEEFSLKEKREINYATNTLEKLVEATGDLAQIRSLNELIREQEKYKHQEEEK